MFVRGSIFSLVLAVSLTTIAAAAPSPNQTHTDRSVVRAAVDAAELSPQKTKSLRIRLHLASLLPQLRVTFGRGWQLSSSRDYLLETPTTENDRLSYALSASWDLARLLVPHEELHLAKEEQRRAMLRLRLEERVARLLSERCRLAQQRGTPAAQANLAAIDATLDVLTSGKFQPPSDDARTCRVPPLRNESSIDVSTDAEAPSRAADE